jgi:hypothetical protein
MRRYALHVFSLAFSFTSIVFLLQFNRLVLGKMLSALGYEVIYGQNGVEAVDYYSQHAEALFCVLMVSIAEAVLVGIVRVG